MKDQRPATKADLHEVAAFITRRFWGLEQYALLTQGMKDPMGVMTRFNEVSLPLFLAKGDILIEGDSDIRGVLVGIPARSFSLLNMARYSLGSYHLLSGVSKEDIRAFQKNGGLQELVHDRLWYRKYSKSPYYINWIAVAEESKGAGVFRRLITPILGQCDASRTDVILETHTRSNVAIYEHFGFELVGTHTHERSPLTEYCMIRRSR